MRSNKLKISLGALAAALSVSAAQANVLTFGGNICNGGGACSNYALIDATYGDVAGQLDVVYDRNIAAGGETRLSWWDVYSGSPAVAWGDSGATVEIFLQPLAGYQVTLNSLFMGSYLNANRGSQLTILSGAGATLFSSGALNVGAAGLTFTPNLTSVDGLRIQFGPDGFDVGLDNIDFSISRVVAGVPEPASWAMMIAGVAATGAMLRRRRKASVRFA